ncbi:GntR family transcriptional regulator [Gleimia hominis]|uniref:GntR family transcriptional regulator n=1 Tax=Gleimia hominis TaxID=595468 RepID=UPI0013045CFA|nr:GntR family transcriptional regulator [Gleimia hominis]WIK63760.1 GntR family transcriptional regulator [Gleimia hominis]
MKSTFLAQVRADTLGQVIRGGNYAQGEHLAPEAVLAATFSFAGGTTRGALAILEEDNVIPNKPGVGIFVSYHGYPLDNTSGRSFNRKSVGLETQVETKRITYDANGHPAEYVISYLHPQYFSVHSAFTKGKQRG